MPILRDIVARLSLELDRSSFTKANRSLKGLADQAAEIGSRTAPAIAALGAMGFAAGKLVQLGSDANETLNLLNESFKDQSQAVQDWASTFATEANRSEFELREMAGTLGAVLNPLMDENTEVAANMSTKLAQLSVDLGSFFNVADSDALAALRSGIVGETEAIKRLGIVMLDATLEAFRLEKGITKTFKSMTIAEKTALRYEFILDQTRLAQGDAARTAEGWANASKGLSTALKDLGTRLGLSIIPFAEKVVTSTRNLVRGFLEWQRGTKLLQSALIVLGAIGTKIAIGLLIAWAPVLFPILKFVAIVVIAALVLDDFLTLLAGGDSVIGRFIDSILGPGSATAAVAGLKEAWESMVLFWNAEVIPSMRVLRSFFLDTAEDVRSAWDGFFESVRIGFEKIQQAMMRFGASVRNTIETAADFLGIDANSLAGAVFAGDPLAALGVPANPTPGFRATVPNPAAAAAAAGGPGTNTEITNNSVVNVQGNATRQDAARIADASGEAQRKANRRTRAALVQKAEG